MLLFILLLVFIAISVSLAWFLLANDRGQREPVVALWLAAGFGVMGAAMAGILEGRLIPAGNLSATASQGVLLTTAMLVGIIEEGCKFGPLALLLWRKPYFNEHTDGVIYFALAGLG